VKQIYGLRYEGRNNQDGDVFGGEGGSVSDDELRRLMRYGREIVGVIMSR
jgi:hypothetical protein